MVVLALVLLAVLAAAQGVVMAVALALLGREITVAVAVVVTHAVAVAVLQQLAIVALVLLVERAVLEQQAAYLALVLLTLVAVAARALVGTVQAVLAAVLHGPITPLQTLVAVEDVHGTHRIQVLMVAPALSLLATLAHNAGRVVR